MKVCTIGCGTLGLIVSCAMAEIGHKVYSIDSNNYRIKNINDGVLDFCKPDLRESILKNVQENKIKFISEYEFETDTDVYIITSEEDEIKSIILKILRSISRYSLILIKSAISIGTINSIKEELQNITVVEHDIVINPELLNDNESLDDFLNNKKIIAGTQSPLALGFLKELYKPISEDIISMDEETAELTKLAYDCLLATNISYVNELANMASLTNADIQTILNCIDDKIKKDTVVIRPCLGFNATITKSIDKIVKTADKYKCDLNTIKFARIANENQRRIFLSKILKFYNYSLEGKVFCIWCISHKQNLELHKETQYKTVVDTLSRYGAQIKIYNVYMENSSVKPYKTKEDALLSTDALIVLSNNDELKNPDFEFMAKNLKDKVVFDADGMYSDVDFNKYGLKYYYAGKRN